VQVAANNDNEGNVLMIKKILAVSVLCLLGASAVALASDLGDQREAAMKKIGGSVAQMAGIAKGEKPYDAATVKTSLETISATIKTFPDLFPADKPDSDGHAKPEIWENMADFKAHAAKLGSDADMLLAQLPADQAAVGAALGTLGKNCSGCHQDYRLKK
jgi:cytochrome c556